MEDKVEKEIMKPYTEPLELCPIVYRFLLRGKSSCKWDCGLN